MKTTLRKQAAAALVLLAPLGAALVTQPAAAQNAPQYRVAQSEQGRIRTMSINSDGGLRPGATLRAQVYATPGARWANVNLGGEVRVPLREVSPGEYVGSYVIRRGDRIDPRQLMTVHAGWGDSPVTLAFNFPPSFQALSMGNSPAAVGAPVVTSFVADLSGRLEPGRVVHFRLQGTPNSQVVINIPKTVQNLPMKEREPGVYVASYTIRRSDDPDMLDRAVANFRSGDEHVAARVNISRERGGVAAAGRDTVPPRIFEVMPGNGDRLSDGGRPTRLAARFSDEGSGIDPASVRLRIDGRDVTADTRITADEIHFRGDLPRGRHVAELIVSDRAGNASRTSWSFDLV